MPLRRNRYHLEERINALDDWYHACQTEPDLLKRMMLVQKNMKVQQKPTEQQAIRFDQLMQETAKKVGYQPVIVTQQSVPVMVAKPSTIQINATVEQIISMFNRGMLKETDKVVIL